MVESRESFKIMSEAGFYESNSFKFITDITTDNRNFYIRCQQKKECEGGEFLKIPISSRKRLGFNFSKLKKAPYDPCSECCSDARLK